MKKIYLVLLFIWTALAQSAAQNMFIRGYSNLPFDEGVPSLLLPEDIALLSDQGYLFTSYVGYITRTDLSGVPLSTWYVERANTTVPAGLNLSQVAQANDNSFYLCGRLNADSNFVALINFDGNIIWQKSYVETSNELNDIEVTNDGGVIVLSTISNGSNQNAITVLTKFDTSGSLAWQKRYTNSDNEIARVNLKSMQETVDGAILLCGNQNSTPPAQGLVAKLSSDGTPEWAFRLFSTNNGFEFAEEFTLLENGNYKVVVSLPVNGSAFGNIEFTATGSVISAHSYSGQSAALTGAELAPDGTLTSSFVNLPSVFRQLPDNSFDFAYEVNLTEESVFLIQNSLTAADGTALFFGGYTVSFFGDFTPAIVKTGSSGFLPEEFISSFTFTEGDYFASLVAYPLAATTTNSIGDCEIEISSVPVLDDFLFTDEAALINENELPRFSIYPNPADDFILLESEEKWVNWVMYNQSGQPVKHQSYSAEYSRINVFDLPSGTYYLVISYSSGKRISKVLVQR